METPDSPTAGARVPSSFHHGPCLTSPFETVTSAFFHHVSKHPSCVAARDLSGRKIRTITYAELGTSATQLARRLIAAGVQPGSRVPLVVKRSIEMLIGMLAILASGAQYVPLDGGVVPDSTLEAVFAQTQCRVVLCVDSTRDRLASFSSRFSTILIEDDSQADSISADGMEEKVIDMATPDGGCYVIYTSGTTGTPKGVDVTHKNVTNLVCLAPGNLGIGPGTRVGQILNVSFDMAAWEVLGCLCNGGTLIIRGAEWELALAQMDVMICTPSILTKYDPAAFPSIKVVATAGEPSSQKLADRWAQNGTYYNCCGPTETTIVNTMHKHIAGQQLSIGRPTPNNHVYILDVENKPVSIGDTGVMWAGGGGISRGYVGLPELTAQKYKPDTFIGDGSMMFNTGDLCRWEPDGTITILGRIDDQVKIKGFRVELDGVSASLDCAPNVERGVALLIDGEIHGFICPETCSLPLVKAHLRNQQPYYAIPSVFHKLNVLPTTANGKVDKKVLLQIAGSAESAVPLAAPERALVAHRPALYSFPRGSNVSSATTNASSASSITQYEKPDLSRDIPEKKLPQPLRGLIHRIFIVYRRLFTLVGLGNLGALVAMLVLGPTHSWMATATAVNLITAVLVRQDVVINILYTVACSVPKWYPLALRARCAKIYHLGGVHSGAAFCAAMWFLGTNVADQVCQSGTCASWPRYSLASRVVSWLVSTLFLVMLASAWPAWRKLYHNAFERTHRFVGWTMLALFWAQIVLAIDDSRPKDTSLGLACVQSPVFWLLLTATTSIASSWFFLRKVRVDAEVLSDHAVRLHFDYTVPVNGTFTRLSRRPLLEWHSFATIPAPVAVEGRGKGYSLVVSNAGDWTRSCIQNPPTRLWVRGLPACGVMRIATLFNRVVVIATGSGIGPLLGHVQDPSCATQLIWSTPNPEKTFGASMLQMIRQKIPGAVIHDTKVLGRPDLVKMGYNLAVSFRAEAVIIIANEKITKKVVYGLETRGIAAYGAIWDS